MILHHIKTAWRNLLKYKTQNLISILCLAVGVVCFSIVLRTVSGVVTEIYFDSIDSSVVKVSVYEKGEGNSGGEFSTKADGMDVATGKAFPADANFINRLNGLNLPSIREIQFNEDIGVLDFQYEDATEQAKSMKTTMYICSPCYLNYRRYRSDITGDIIHELNEGDVLISDNLRDMVYGKGADPRGFRILSDIDGSQRIIRDVVDMSASMNSRKLYPSIYYCCRTIPEGMNYRLHRMKIELSDGHTVQELQDELNAGLPEYDIYCRANLFSWATDGALLILCVCISLFLGCSVLTIGVTGFLKMQLQLFSLRSRELALRRSMGARPYQLFGLLASEIVIVSFFTTITSAIINTWLAHYIMPVESMASLELGINTARLFLVEFYIILATIIVTVLIALAFVYKQLHAPIGMHVGRSGHPRTLGQSAMLCGQFVVGMSLIFTMGILLSSMKMHLKRDYGSVYDNTELYRRAIIMDKPYAEALIPDFANIMAADADVDHISTFVHNRCEAESAEHLDESLITHHTTQHGYNQDGSNADSEGYAFLYSDEGFFDHLDIPVRADMPADKSQSKHTCSVYVRTEEAERMCQKWKLPAGCAADTLTRNFYDGHSYTRIGYADAPVYYRNSINMPSFWIVDNTPWHDDATMREQLHVSYPSPSHIIFPKAGKYSKVENNICKLYQDAHPGSLDFTKLDNLYDTWFHDIHISGMIANICLLLVFVSLLCIVASVYSAISLESRGRQKEVALRKIHGAHSLDIIRLFASYYVRLLLVGGSITGSVTILLLTLLNKMSGVFDGDDRFWLMAVLCLLVSFIIVTAVTLITISHKVVKVSRINAADVIKQD
ncbi:MAG: ABC transporter permease [Bacteroidaceae bacterium]|nr:ABC transporter permease [Bacteroidaceae bacterium]